MNAYRIHITRDSREAQVHASSHASDFAAIRHARHLAADAAHVEVWCGSRCVFAGVPAIAPIPDAAREPRHV